MLDTETKRRIDTARDILVGKLPDPKSQIEQITIALIYKFMDDMDKQSEELGGKSSFFKGEYSKYSWSKIFDSRLSGFEMFGLYSEAITRMSQNPNIPQLFRDIFKNAYLPYRDPETLKSFLKIINDFHYDHSEKLGDAFEYLLSVMGSQGDAGQFRTPRHIIDFIVKVIDPKKNETILDPACGTAGFLIFAYKNILEKNKDESGRLTLTPEERKKLVDNFVGYDISPDMVRLSLVNLYLHGFQNPHIYEYDTLTSEEKWNDMFDVVLANPPFMTPKGGIKPHKRFAIQANRSEVLFVDYIAEHLTTNGRAGIIVPEGIIFQSANAYQSLRKMLLHKYLWAVVSLPAGVFNPYSGVKTSILLLDKNISKKSKDIIFIKAENDGFGLGAQRKEIKDNDLHEALVILKEYQKSVLEGRSFKSDSEIAIVVSKEKITEDDYNFGGDRYKEIVQTKEDKYEMVELGEVVDFETGSREKGGAIDNGIPSIGGEQIAEDGSIRENKMKYVSEEHFKDMKKGILKDNDVLMVKDGATTGKIGFYKKIYEKAGINEHVYILRAKKEISPVYLYNLLKTNFFQTKLKRYIKGIIGGVSSEIKQIKIPLPPLEVQTEIVKKINEKQIIINNAKELIANVERERANSREVFERLKCDWVELSEIAEIISGQSPESEFYNNTGAGVPFYQGKTNFGDFYIRNPESWTTKTTKIAEENDILMSVRAPVGPVNLATQKICIGRGLAAIRPKNKILTKYLFYYLKYLEDRIKGNGGAVFDSINREKIAKISTPLPDLETQKQLIARFDKQEDAIKANKALIEVMQENINEKVSEVWLEDGENKDNSSNK